MPNSWQSLEKVLAQAMWNLLKVKREKKKRYPIYIDRQTVVSLWKANKKSHFGYIILRIAQKGWDRGRWVKSPVR